MAAALRSMIQSEAGSPMHTTEWMNTREERARDVIARAKHDHLGLGMLFGALQEITDEPSEEAARILARAFDALSNGEMSFLAGEFRRAMDDLARGIEHEISEREQARPSATSLYGRGLMALATIGLALAWAPDPPSDGRLYVL